MFVFVLRTGTRGRRRAHGMLGRWMAVAKDNTLDAQRDVVYMSE